MMSLQEIYHVLMVVAFQAVSGRLPEKMAQVAVGQSGVGICLALKQLSNGVHCLGQKGLSGRVFPGAVEGLLQVPDRTETPLKQAGLDLLQDGVAFWSWCPLDLVLEVRSLLSGLLQPGVGRVAGFQTVLTETLEAAKRDALLERSTDTGQ